MNKFTILFLILFFVVVIFVGMLAVRDQLFKKSEAGSVCSTPKIDLDKPCPPGQKSNLVRNETGCFVFKCQ